MMNYELNINARLVASMAIVEFHTSRKLELLQRRAKALSQIYKQKHEDLEKARNWLRYLQKNASRYGAITVTNATRRTRHYLIEGEAQAARMENELSRMMERTKEMRELSTSHIRLEADVNHK